VPFAILAGERPASRNSYFEPALGKYQITMEPKTLCYSIHPIDIDGNSVSRDTVQDEADVKSFVSDLISATVSHDEKRRFLWSSDTTEVRALMGKVAAAPEQFDAACERIAKRLHRTEKDAQKRHEHITDLQRGTLFQLFFKEGEVMYALIAKVFVSRFLDEDDYQAHAGLPFEKRILKTCLVEFDEDCNITSVSLSDSTGRIAEFWWKEFLELEEQTTDEFNTRTAFAAMESFLGRKLKQDFRADYSHLRNHLVSYFRTRGVYSHREMLENVFGSYKPVQPSLDLRKLRQEADKLPETKGFDSTFSIPDGVLDRRCRRVVALSEQIDLQIKDAIDDEAVVAASLRDGTKGVFVRSDTGYDEFRPSKIAIPTVTVPLGCKVKKEAKKQQMISGGN
jgi:hypothetical protein